ncbi:hypothetical protein QUF99_25190 [Bacillus sp. DX4.1]|nr:hypothetical protein [Bacillus sp. DX4.1]MDM5190519.1 hypothetical protein [Bacillus sp. DX4.1]
MLKIIFAFFLLLLISATGFFTFSYFVTEEYDGQGMLYTQIPYVAAV